MSPGPMMPGQAIDIPLVPEIAECFGYRHDARYVSFHVVPDMDDLVFDDGRSSGNCATWAFQAYRRHRAVGSLLDGVRIGTGGGQATHCLLIDREANRARIAPLAEAGEFLRRQWSHLPEARPGASGAAEMTLDDLLDLAGWREERVDMAAVQKAMAEQRGRVGRMISFLDMCPVPPGKGEGRG